MSHRVGEGRRSIPKVGLLENAVLVHRDTDMIIWVYGKYIADFNGTRDGNSPNAFYESAIDKDS